MKFAKQVRQAQTFFSEFHCGHIMSWYVLFRTRTNLGLFTFRYVAHKQVTEHAITLKEIFDKQDNKYFLKAHVDVRFCYEIRRTKHELSHKIMNAQNKIKKHAELERDNISFRVTTHHG